MVRKCFFVDGVEHNIEIDPDVTLDVVLRDQLGFSHVRRICGKGSCGLCTVKVNGESARSCVLRMGNLPDKAEISV